MIAPRPLDPRAVLGVAAMAGVAALAVALTTAHAPAPESPRLIGYGCEGTSGPIYAMEESDFPRCAAIEANE